MKKLNCPNCGAPINPDTNKCSYCGTSYFDLSTIDIFDPKPFYLKIKMGNNVLTQLVIPDSSETSIQSNTETVYCYDHNTKINKFIRSRGISTNIKFNGIVDENNELYTITKYED